MIDEQQIVATGPIVVESLGYYNGTVSLQYHYRLGDDIHEGDMMSSVPEGVEVSFTFDTEEGHCPICDKPYQTWVESNMEEVLPGWTRSMREVNTGCRKCGILLDSEEY